MDHRDRVERLDVFCRASDRQSRLPHRTEGQQGNPGQPRGSGFLDGIVPANDHFRLWKGVGYSYGMLFCYAWAMRMALSCGIQITSQQCTSYGGGAHLIPQ